MHQTPQHHRKLVVSASDFFLSTMCSVESIISNQLNIRFIDAHIIATEAKLNLGFHGYTDDYETILQEAIRIIQDECTTSDKIAMKVLHDNLRTILKHQKHSSCDESLEAATTTTRSSGYDSVEESSRKRKSFFHGRFWKGWRNVHTNSN